ncbi:DUF2236 domain-containing protein [Micrococcales bacterium 31B]|nr:DUF2236 domain-containing protein [Micrococcales bacterium 31B]
MQRDLRRTLAVSEDGRDPEWVDQLAHGTDRGYLPADGAVWSVHSHVATVIGGIRALLMQALHPGAMAGVAEHSNYRSDPLARLSGTIRWMMTVTFADTAGARRVCEYVRHLHEPVVGDFEGPRGEHLRYSANDASLARWVHVAFADSFLAVHLAYGPRGDARTAGFADRYVDEWAIAGTLMGAAEPPRSRAELDAYIDDLTASGVLRCDERTREVVHFLRKPPLAPSLGFGYQVLFRAAVATLRPEHRRMLGLEHRGGTVVRWTTRPLLALVRCLLAGESGSARAARARHARLDAEGR